MPDYTALGPVELVDMYPAGTALVAVPGPQGLPGIVEAATAPDNHDVLWLDTSSPAEIDGYPFLPTRAGETYMPAVRLANAGIYDLGALIALPVYVSQSMTATALCMWTGSVTTPGRVRMGIYADNGGLPGALIVDGGPVDYTDPGVRVSVSISQPLVRGWYWIAGCTQTGEAQFRGAGVNANPSYSQLASDYGFVSWYQASGTHTGALPANPTWVAGTNFGVPLAGITF